MKSEIIKNFIFLDKWQVLFSSQRTPSPDRRTDEPVYSETFESPENKTTSPKKSETLLSPDRSLESGPLSPTLSEGELSRASEASERSPTFSSTRVRIRLADSEK